jgi:shikimate kinase
MKTVYILIGPKGSGKTYIGQLLEQELGIPFLQVEPIFLAIKGESDALNPHYLEKGYRLVEEAVASNLQTNDSVAFDSTGAALEFKHLLARLETRYSVKLIRIHAPADLCLSRIKARDKSLQIPVSEELIETVNRLSVAAEFDYALTIDNGGASDEKIISAFRSLF